MRALPRGSLLKIPRQERSIETVHTILDAAMRVLETEGAAGFTTNRVAEVAGISPGSLYQYFANGERILVGIVERGVLDAEELVRGALAVSADTPIDALLRSALTAVAAHLEPHSALLGEIMATAPLVAMQGITSVLETRILDALREVIARDPTRYHVPGGGAMLYVAVNGTVYVFMKWLSERPPHVSREALVDAIVRGAMVVFTEPPARR